MDRETALAKAKAAHDAIEEADAEAKRIRQEARDNFGAIVNEIVHNRYVMQEDVAAEVEKTREYVRRMQVSARRAAKKKETGS
jgi:F0F1-type ATP synthase membrane subunit b/b'